MAFKTYLSIRPVPRLEYLIEFLKSVREGYDREDARRRIQQIRDEFEKQKAKALGKKKPRPVRGAAIVPQCEKMTAQLRFAARTADGWKLTPDGEQLLSDAAEDPNDFPGEAVKTTLTARLWQVYPRFGKIILAILRQPNGKMDLPMRSEAGSFREAIQQQYQVDCDALTFYVIRELGTQLELLNWYVVETEGRRQQRVYAIACVATLSWLEKLADQPPRTNSPLDACLDRIGSDIGALTLEDGLYQPHTLLNTSLASIAQAKGYLFIEAGGDWVFVDRHHEVEMAALEQELWRCYLEKVDYRPLFPVLYPELRNEVCYQLRLPDKTFDQNLLRLIEKPQRLRIYPSGGTLNYASNLAHLHKYLPPQTSHKHFMIYLKIEQLE